MRDCFTGLPRKSEAMTEITMGRGGAGIEIDGPAERCERLLGAPLHHRGITERNLAPRVELIKRNSTQHVLAAGVKSLVAINPSIVCGKHQAKRKQASCSR